MIGLDLMGEWRRRPGNDAAAMDLLAELEISIEAQIRAGGVWVQNVTTAGHLFTPDPNGRTMVILPVWSGGADTVYTAPEVPWINDFLTFDGADPQRWWYRTGAGGVLGEDLLELALETGEPITVHAHPLAWLQADCRGAVLLDHLELTYRAAWFCEDLRAAA